MGRRINIAIVPFYSAVRRVAKRSRLAQGASMKVIHSEAEHRGEGK